MLLTCNGKKCLTTPSLSTYTWCSLEFESFDFNQQPECQEAIHDSNEQHGNVHPLAEKRTLYRYLDKAVNWYVGHCHDNVGLSYCLERRKYVIGLYRQLKLLFQQFRVCFSKFFTTEFQFFEKDDIIKFCLRMVHYA